MMNLVRRRVLILFVTLLLLPALPALGQERFNYRVGVGKADITGPAGDIPMFGFSKAGQNTAGIHFRLFARAFVAAEPDGENRVAIAVADIGSTPHEIQREVVDKLAEQFGDAYTLANTLVTATHTHSGPGGYWHYGVGSPLGSSFNKAHFDHIVNGIVAAISQAHEGLSPGRIVVGTAEVEDAGAQRSAPAYLANPESERAKYGADTDKRMTLLRFETASGPIGVLNWFAVHPTSMTFDNRLISGDHKGHASALMESDSEFVAAFANSNCGDVTANLNLDNTGPGDDQFETTRIIAERQYEVAADLLDSADDVLEGRIASIQTYVDFSNVTVGAEYTGNGEQHTCASAYGYSFGAGSTEDGGGHPLLREGMLERNATVDNILKTMMPPPSDEFRQCHLPKIILFATGEQDPPMYQQVLPLSIIRIGPLSIVGFPGEITTMAGRRLRDTIAEAFGDSAEQVVIAAYTNDYAGYTTTNEEYNTQQYEGGHTLYGPWTLAAHQQEYAKLARALIDGESPNSDLTPLDLRGAIDDTPLGAGVDAVPVGSELGAAFEDVNSSYSVGDHVNVRFWTGHPQHAFLRDADFASVQRREGNEWVSVATDNSWSTRFHWVAGENEDEASHAYIIWDMPEDTVPGKYRIVHTFWAKKADGNVAQQSATSQMFTIE
jgi:neutral ceramidase